MDARDEVKIIRKHIKQAVPTASVTMGAGTAYGWVDIYPAGRGRAFTASELAALRALGLEPASNWALISPERRRAFAGRLAGGAVAHG